MNLLNAESNFSPFKVADCQNQQSLIMSVKWERDTLGIRKKKKISYRSALF